MNINGQETGSTINADGKTMFNLANDTDLKLENVTVEGAKDYVVNATNENATVNLTNTSIKNTTGTGVISNVDVNVTADGKNVEFTNNSVAAINMQNADKNLTLNTTNNGSITLNDKITGTTGYNVDITGDNTGVVSLYNDIENADVTTSKVTLNTADSNTRNYNLLSMTANEDSKLNLDLDLTNKTADTITTVNESTGTIIINSINTMGANDDIITVQIIKNTNENSDLKLALGENIKQVDDVLANLSDTVYNDEFYAQKDGITLSTTTTKDDSLTIQKSKLYDTLDLITTKESENERNFTFRTTDNYNLSKDLGIKRPRHCNRRHP